MSGTLTSTGYASGAEVRGEADTLRGVARHLEVWTRLRHKHGRVNALRLTFAARRYRVALSGPSIRRGGAK